MSSFIFLTHSRLQSVVLKIEVYWKVFEKLPKLKGYICVQLLEVCFTLLGNKAF